MRLFQFSFRVAVLLFVLTFIPAFPGQARAAADTWVPINSVDVGGSVGRNQSALVFNPSTNEPYVVSVDYANAYAITVKKFNGSSWVPVGSSGFGAASEGNASLAFNPVTNEPYVSYSDKVNGKVSVFRFNGSSWVPVGNAGFSIGNQAFAPTLTFNPNTNEPYVAYLDVGYPPGSQLKNRVVVMKFDGTSWVAVGGTGFDPGSSNPLSIAFDSSTGEPYVAYINGTSHGITMRKFDGTLWVPVSSPGVGTWADLAINPSTNEPVVAYLDDTCGSRISVKRYDGLSWLPFGDQCVATGTPTELDLEFNPLNGHPYIAFIDAFYSANDTFQPVVITFDGTSWVLVPGTGENASGPYDINLAIKPSNGQPYVLYDWAAVSPASSTDPLGIAGITIKTPPTKTAYSAGDSLDLSGLVVTLTKSDGLTQDVTSNNFSAYGITTSKATGDTLTLGDAMIVITVDQYSVSQAVTVEEPCSTLDLSAGFKDYSFPVKENLVVITHGWNGNATKSDSWVKKMQADICKKINHASTTVAVYDWSDGANTGAADLWNVWLHAQYVAYEDAKPAGLVLASIIKALKIHPHNIHFIAHSAGSNVVQNAVYQIAAYYHFQNQNPVNGVKPPTLHLTFLDAYAPDKDSLFALPDLKQYAPEGINNDYTEQDYGNLYGLIGYSEQYVDSRPLASPFPDYTDIQLRNATNFDVTSLDPDLASTDPNHKHNWPIDIYSKSITEPRYLTSYNNESFQFGFPLSSEDVANYTPPNTKDHLGKWCIVTNVFEPYRRCLDSKTNQVRNAILTDPTRAVTINVPNNTSNYLVDVSQFISNGVGVLPKITMVDISNSFAVQIPSQTTVTSDNSGWDGVFTAPQKESEYCVACNLNGNWRFNFSAIKIGLDDSKLLFNRGVRIYFPGEGGKNVGFERQGEGFHEITSTCSSDNQSAGDALPSGGACKVNINNNTDLVVWTKHFTTFVTYDQIDDTVAPTTTPVITGTLSSGTTYIGTTTIALNAVDNVGGVGVATTTYSLDGGAWQTYATTSPLVVTAGGDHMLQFFSTDWFGNQEATSTLNFSIITTGKLVVTKRTLGGDGTFGFMGDAGAFSVTTVAGVGSTTVSSLLPGIYSVSETATPGWTLVSSDCSQVSIVLGETTSCIVTNAKQGHIVVKVVASTTTTVFPFVASYASAGFSVGAGSQDDSGLLDPGTYAVSENIPDGWVLASSTCSDGSSVGAIVLDPGETVTCTFTNSKGIDKNNASISGVKFEDKNGNGKQDSGEKGLFGWVIYIDTNNNGRFDWGERFTITNFKGEYQLRRLSAGTYTIREVLWPGWQQMFPATGSYSVKLTVGQTVTDKDFGNFKKGRIGGTVFEDKNGNGKLDRREGSLGGWAVTLTGPDDTTKTATTDRSGRYSFSDLGPGTYTVREVLRVGWKQTTKNVSVAVIQSGTYVPDADVGVTRVK